jgi:hypothetical protein
MVDPMRVIVRSARLAVVVLAVGLACPVSAAAAGAWQWPLAGTPVVERGFDPPPVPWAAGHRGVDLRGRVGDAVLAAGPGVVGFAGLLAGRGVVAVHHADGLETTYEPLVVAVRAGQRVAQGALLGRLTAGHGACGPGYACLHWGLRRGETYLDPLRLVHAGPIRLLPVWRSTAGAAASGSDASAVGASRAQHAAPAQQARGPTIVTAAGAVGAVGVGTGVLLATGRRRGASAGSLLNRQ